MADGLFSLFVFLRDRENPVTLWLESFARAEAARERLIHEGETADDYGHHLRLPPVMLMAGEPPPPPNLAGFMISDMDLEHRCQTELAIRQARAQASANAAAANDPTLRLAMTNRPQGMRLG